MFSDTGKTKADVTKDRFMVNQENERPDQQRRSVKHDIVPTWEEVHKGQLISKAISRAGFIVHSLIHFFFLPC